MHYLIISFSHKNTDIAVREKLAFGNDLEIDTFLKRLLQNEYINEAILLSTCNRVELIMSVSDVTASNKIVFEHLSDYAKIDIDELEGRADIYEDQGAVHHIFAVSSSLDSLVIGETQITGQLKDAFKLSIAKGYCSQKLARVLHYSFKCAASVRNATIIGKNPVSVASTAVMKARDVIDKSDKKTDVKAVVIGTGEMSELTIRHLLKNNFQVIVISRDMKKAHLLATTFDQDIEVHPYEHLTKLINKKQLLFSATSAPYPIIKADMVEEVDFERYWFHIAVPRDIEEIDSPNLHIYSVDDLQDIVNKNMEARQEQAKSAYSIIGRFTHEFYEWLQTLGVEPIIKHLNLQAQEIIEKKLNIAIKKGFIGIEDRANVEKLAQSIMTEFLHHPTTRLKKLALTAESDVMVGTVQSLFGLKDDTKMLNKYKCEHAMGHQI